MPITGKPFLKSLKLNRILFKPKPNMFTDQDLNRVVDSLTDRTIQANQLAGGTRVNWELQNDAFELVMSSEYASVNDTFSPFKPAGSDPAFLNIEGIQFTAPLTALTIAATIPIEEWKNAIYICLIAKKTISPSPVSSSEFPTLLPGPDIEQWGDERLAWTWKNPNTISLTSGEILIGVVATYRYQPHWQLDFTTKRPDNFGGSWEFFHHLRDLNNPNEVLNFTQIMTGEPLFPRYKDTFQRGSVWETLAGMAYALNERLSKLTFTKVSKNEPDKLWASLSENIGTPVAAGESVTLTGTGNYFKVTGDSISANIRYLSSLEPTETSEGSVITLYFEGRYTLFRNAGSPAPGYKKIKFSAPVRTTGGYNPTSLAFSAGTLVKLREKADAWWIEDVQGPDSIFDKASGLSNTWGLGLHITEDTTYTFNSNHLTNNLIFDSGEWSQTRPFSATTPYDAATGVFTVPKTGLYTFKAVMLLRGNQSTGNKALVIQNRATNDLKVLAWTVGTSAQNNLPLCGCMDFIMTAGQTYAIKVQDFNDNGGTIPISFFDSEAADMTGASANAIVSSLAISYNGYFRAQDDD